MRILGLNFWTTFPGESKSIIRIPMHRSKYLMSAAGLTLLLQCARCVYPAPVMLDLLTLSIVLFIITLFIYTLVFFYRVSVLRKKSEILNAVPILSPIVIITFLSLTNPILTKRADSIFLKQLPKYEEAVRAIRVRGLIPKDSNPKILQEDFPELGNSAVVYAQGTNITVVFLYGFDGGHRNRGYVYSSDNSLKTFATSPFRIGKHVTTNWFRLGGPI